MRDRVLRTVPQRPAAAGCAFIEHLESRRLFYDPAAAGALDPSAAAVAALPEVSISAPDRIAGEAGPDTGTFLVSRSGGDLSQPLAVKFIIGGTATNAVDYGVISPDLTLPAGRSAVSFFVKPVADNKVEPRESVTLTLGVSSAYAVAATGSAATVLLNDRPLPVVSIETIDRVASEAGRNTGALRFTRSGGDPSQPLVVNFIVGGTATNGVDYGVVAPSVIIAAGQTSYTLTVTPIADQKLEPRESITLTLAANTGRYAVSPANPAATMVIHDASTGDIGYFSANVNFQPYDALPPPRYVVDGGATYKKHPSGLVYGWNRSKTTTAVDRNSPLAYDQRYDTHNTLDADDTWSIAVPNGTYLAHVVAGDPEQFGGVSRIDVEGVRTIDRESTSSNRFTDGTRIVNVTDGAITIKAGSGAGPTNNKLVFVNLTQLSDASGRQLATSVVSFSDSHGELREPTEDGELELRRTGATEQPLTVTYVVAGTATAGSDYHPPPGTITIPAGTDRVPFFIEVINDQLDEPTETVTILLLSGPGYVVDGDIDGACLLFDND